MRTEKIILQPEETMETIGNKFNLRLDRRGAIKALTAAAATAAISPFLLGSAKAMMPTMAAGVALKAMAPDASETYPYQLPQLPYAVNALDAAIDPMTMEIHHGKHHKGYTDKLNAALEGHPDLQKKPLVDLLSNLDGVPEDVRTAVRNNGGGYYNHSLFWPLMSPNGGGTPGGKLGEAINRDFGAFEKFREDFAKAAGTVFGSGWAWLVADKFGKLSIMQTFNQDTVLAKGIKPVLGIDVWEHAYYLRYQNRRPEYIENFWKVVNWNRAAMNYDAQ